jgi:phosphoribosylformylglycinamidine synthase
LINACTDLSDGGLALAAFELAQASGVGVVLDSDETPFLFGEDQGRYLVACSFDKAEALMIAAGQAGVPIQTVGKFSGDTVWMGQSCAPLEDLSATFRTTFADIFA